MTSAEAAARRSALLGKRAELETQMSMVDEGLLLVKALCPHERMRVSINQDGHGNNWKDTFCPDCSKETHTWVSRV